jgi:hypothetical protein
MSSQANAEIDRTPEVNAIEWNVVEVKAGPGRRLQVRFADNTSGAVYFDDAFFTGVFEVLKDEALFRRVYVELGAVTWPGGLDLAPDAMYDEIKRNGEWVLR